MQVTPEYSREIVAAILGLEQLVQQYAMGLAPPVLTRIGGTMVNPCIRATYLAFIASSYEYDANVI